MKTNCGMKAAGSSFSTLMGVTGTAARVSGVPQHPRDRAEMTRSDVSIHFSAATVA
jgi:hypothetical protein